MENTRLVKQEYKQAGTGKEQKTIATNPNEITATRTKLKLTFFQSTHEA